MPEAYNSIHTGEQIDQGISVILNNDIPGVVNEAKKFAEASKASSEASANSATDSANSASQSAGHATTSENFSKASESFAKGGTGTRPGEDTDNAKYYSELAAGSAGGAIGALTFNGRNGNVMPEKGDYGPDQGNATLDSNGKIFKNQLPDEILSANIPRSPTPPTDPDTKLYIDTSLANDDFYTAGEMDTKLTEVNSKFDRYSTTEQMNTQIDTKVSDAIAAIPARDPGSNQNLIVNSWFQILQTPMVNNEICDRWFVNAYGPTASNSRAKLTTLGINLINGAFENKDGKYSAIITQLVLKRFTPYREKFTISAYLSDGKVSSFSFYYNIRYGSIISSPTTNDIQFRILKQPLNFSGTTYDNWRLYIYFMRDPLPGETTTITIRNVKLEVGDYSTIIYDSPITYAQDLLECQRYRMVYSKSYLQGQIVSTSMGYLTFPIKTSLWKELPWAEGFSFDDCLCSDGTTIPYSSFDRSKIPDVLSVDDQSVTIKIPLKSPVPTSKIGPCVYNNVFCTLSTGIWPPGIG